MPGSLPEAERVGNAALSDAPKGHSSPVPGSPAAERRAGTSLSAAFPLSGAKGEPVIS